MQSSGNKVRSRAAAAAAAVMMAAAPSPSAAQTLSAMRAVEIEATLIESGLAVEMTEDAASGAPVARASMGDIVFWVRGLDCSGDACATLLFFANFELGRAVADADYRVVNRFNDKQVFGRAYLLEADRQVGVDYVIELDGGVSQENVAANVSRWADVVAAFIDHFRSGAGAS